MQVVDVTEGKQAFWI